MHKQVTRASLGKATAVAFVLALGADTASGEAERFLSGEQVYRETCSTCHASGVANAPRFGDRKAWAPLIEEGQDVLTAHAWVGVRAMPRAAGDRTSRSGSSDAPRPTWCAPPAGAGTTRTRRCSSAFARKRRNA